MWGHVTWQISTVSEEPAVSNLFQEEGKSGFLQIVGICLSNYTVSHLRGLQSQQLLAWETQISLFTFTINDEWL
jgi:hypothetical protein